MIRLFNRCLNRCLNSLSASCGSATQLPGIELDDATGKNDGEVKGVRLFSCEPNRGAVMRPSAVEIVDDTVFKCAAPKGEAAAAAAAGGSGLATGAGEGEDGEL